MQIEKSTIRKHIKCGGLFIVFMWCSFPPVVHSEENHSPYAGQSYPVNVYWGDTHLHTNMSNDGFVTPAYGINPVGRLTPDDAYFFAKGKTVVATNGMPVRLSRPLDFLVVSDHAEAMGLMYGLATKNSLLLKSKKGRKWYKKIKEIDEKNSSEITASFIFSLPLREFFQDRENKVYKRFRTSVWHEVIDNAERHNFPGKFTAFVGYEWTGMVYAGEGRGWWHRNVIFKDGKDKLSGVLPYSQVDSSKPEDLWAYMSDYESATGGEVLAIPHNPNLSGGRMFRVKDSQDQAFTREYALTRSVYEPLVEVTQTKGDSETHPVLSPNDEFSDFDRWTWFGRPGREKSDRKYDYVRPALKLGLEEHSRLGVNPFKFGMIGGTDSHNTLSNMEESNFGGKLLELEPSKERLMKSENWFEKVFSVKNTFSAAGYAAIWAQENTRESLFSAMKRRETYATTGPRMTVRFFGGWEYEATDALRPDLAKIGYTKGVPMGGDLTNGPNGKSPNFLIRAVKDPDGANLDRVQVIKGWRDNKGGLHEKVYNVALSDNRREDEEGRAPVVGSTVNVEDASYVNSIGDPELSVVWQDPDFNKDELAFYYVRVLEIPTPRWTAYDAKFFGIKDIPDEVSMVAQERAYTSPIWYTP